MKIIKMILFIQIILIKNIAAKSIITKNSSFDSILIQVDNTITSLINKKVNPCDDFYEFACGNWPKIHPIGSKDFESSTFSIVSDNINKEILFILNDTTTYSKNSNIGLIKARKQFKACMNTAKIEKLDNIPLLNYLKNLNIPFFDEKSIANWNVLDSVSNYTKYHAITPMFFDVDVSHDHFNSSKMIIKLDEGSLGLTRELLLNDTNAETLYKNLIELVLESVFPHLPTHFNMSTISYNIIEFEKKLAKISLDEYNKVRSNSLHRTTINELRAAVPTVDWLKFLQYVFSNDSIDGEFTIVTVSPSYLYEITNTIISYPKRNVANYMLWRIIQSKLPYLGCRYRKLHNIYTKLLNKDPSLYDNVNKSKYTNFFFENCSKIEFDESHQPRDEYCSNSVNNQFGIAIASAYIDKYLKNEELEQAKNLISSVISALEKRITQHKWIDIVTRKKILDKMDGISKKIGYPLYIYNESYIDRKFGDHMLTIEEDTFFENINQMDLLFRKLSLKKLFDPLNREKWHMYPQTLNAMYQFFNNEIVIPAGILRQPFYYPHTNNIPISLSFGALGSIVGHELTHAIDSTGRKFDKNGNAVKEWWEGEALIEFNKRAICFLEQYSDYFIFKKYIDGRRTLAENIADNGGINIAYNAYINYLQKNSLEYSLTQIPFSKTNFTNHQLFFISFAQQYCTNVQIKYAQINMLSESHAPSKYRVIGSLSNMAQFSDAFQCHNNTNMNRTNKCTLW